MQQPSQWSIGIYRGSSPLDMQPSAPTPVVTTDDVTDVSARLVADPFLISVDERWFMFFEIVDRDAGRGKIGYATSIDTHFWHYRGIVLEEPFHLSYPHVFKANGEIFMTPETASAGAIRLYRADDFPTSWRLVGQLVEQPLVDPTPFQTEDGWWMFGCRPRKNDRLTLYYADRLLGPWHPHPANPLTDGCLSSSRPAGRVISWNGRRCRFAQQCEPYYGVKVRGFSIETIDRTTFAEREFPEPVLQPGTSDWSQDGMHHLDLHPHADGWIAAVDGFRFLPSA